MKTSLRITFLMSVCVEGKHVYKLSGRPWKISVRDQGRAGVCDRNLVPSVVGNKLSNGHQAFDLISPIFCMAAIYKIINKWQSPTLRFRMQPLLLVFPNNLHICPVSASTSCLMEVSGFPQQYGKEAANHYTVHVPHVFHLGQWTPGVMILWKKKTTGEERQGLPESVSLSLSHFSLERKKISNSCFFLFFGSKCYSWQPSLSGASFSSQELLEKKAELKSRY